MEFKFHLDGSFDLTAGDLRLMRCYPAIDGVPVRPLRAEAGQRRARYELDGGALEIYIEEAQDLLALHCRVEGLQNAHDIMPIANACVEGCDRGFAQGLGMGGPSGFSSWTILSIRPTVCWQWAGSTDALRSMHGRSTASTMLAV